MRLDRLHRTVIATFVAGVSIATHGAATSNADNSGAINQAIAAARASGSNVVVVEPGTFPCNSAIDYTGVTRAGYGPTVSILKIADSASGLQTIQKADLTTNAENAHQAASTFPVKAFLYVQPDATSSGRKANCRIQSVGVDGNGANQADSGSYANIVVTNTSRALVEDVYSYNARPGLTVTGNQRAYCLLLTDDERTTVRGGYYYGSGYDNIGLRGYSVGARFYDVWSGATSGANSRAAFQPAFQCQDFKCVQCWFENTCTDGALSTGVTVHGSQRGRFTDCYIGSTNGNGIYLFGDNTDGGADTNFDQNNLYPSATLDEYSEDCHFKGCTIVGKANVATVNGDGRWVRGHKFEGCTVRHTADQIAVVIQFDGSQGSGPFASGSRRHSFIGCKLIQESTANVGAITYVKGFNLIGCEIMKDNATNNGFIFSGCAQCVIRDNRFHYTGTANNMNVAFYIQQQSTNGSNGFFITGNSFTKVSSNITYGVYVDNTTASSTNIRIFANDFTNCTNSVTFSSAAGTGCQVAHNIGCVTEAVGTCTVANGATTTGNVAHGLTSWRTLRASDIILTPTNSLGNAAKYYVSSIDATNFVVTVNADPGATTATFGWQARANAA